LPAEIKKARALGDLSENAEYHMAKQRQEFVECAAGPAQETYGELSLVNLANIPVTKQGSDRPWWFYDSTKTKSWLPAGDERRGRRLQGPDLHHFTHWPGDCGKKVGDMATIVTPNGKRELEILKLTTIHDEPQRPNLRTCSKVAKEELTASL